MITINFKTIIYLVTFIGMNLLGTTGYCQPDTLRAEELSVCFGGTTVENKGRTKNNLAFLHPVFTTSLIDPQSQNPQHNTAMPAVLLNQID